MRPPFVFFSHSFGRQEADLSCIYAGSSSGGAEDPYVCCVVGGEDGCDGEEEKVMAIIVRKGTKMRNRWLHSAKSCSKLRSPAKHGNLRSYASLYSGDLYKRIAGFEGVETFCLISLSHHAQLHQANQDEKFKPSSVRRGVQFGLL